MVTELEKLRKRVDKIEKQNNEEVLTIVEILSNATFFGQIKKANCEYAKNGQCNFFVLKSEAKNEIPIATDCRIQECEEPILHCHIELSNITCALCKITSSDLIIGTSQCNSKKPKEMIKPQEKLITKLNKKNS